MSWPVPSLHRFQRLVWKMLEERPGHRPAVCEVAAHLGMTELQLRRWVRRNHATPMRIVISWSCLTWAARLIADGTNVEAAALLAGFRNRTNFNRQFKGYFRVPPHEFRGQHVEPVPDPDEWDAECRRRCVSG